MNLNEKYLANMCVFSVCMLLVVWVIPETIALRHCLLILGFIVSGLIIKKIFKVSIQFEHQIYPLIFYLAFLFGLAFIGLSFL